MEKEKRLWLLRRSFPTSVFFLATLGGKKNYLFKYHAFPRLTKEGSRTPPHRRLLFFFTHCFCQRSPCGSGALLHQKHINPGRERRRRKKKKPLKSMLKSRLVHFWLTSEREQDAAERHIIPIVQLGLLSHLHRTRFCFFITLSGVVACF